MHFKISEKDIREDNNSIDSIPEFRPLEDMALKAIFLYYDYDSPFSQTYQKSRWDKIFKTLGKEDGLTAMQKKYKKKWDAAVEMFNSLQVDVEKDMLVSYNDLLASWIELMKKKDKSDKENDFCLKLTKEMQNIIRDKRELEKLIHKRDTPVAPEVKSTQPSIIDD